MNEAPPVDLIAGEIARARLEVMVAGLSPTEAVWAHRVFRQLLSPAFRGRDDSVLSLFEQISACVLSGDEPRWDEQAQNEPRAARAT